MTERKQNLPNAPDAGQKAAARPIYAVSTTTHGKLLSPNVVREPGWITLHAPIIAVDAQGVELPMAEIVELTLPAAAVRQSVRTK